MTNITQKNSKKKMRSHIDQAYKIIKDNLPDMYVDLVMVKLKDDTSLTKGIVRNVKNRVQEYPMSRIAVLNALVEISKDYTKECEKLEELTK